MRQFKHSFQYRPKKFPVYLHLLWLGNVSTKFENQFIADIQRCYYAVETRVVFTTRRIYYLPMTKIILFINFCVAAIVRTWDVHSRGCRNALSNRFAGRSETIILPKIALIFPVPERQTELFKLLPMSLLLDNMFWKANTVTPNSLFLLVDELLSIFPLFKLLLSNLYNLIYVNTRNFFTV